MTLYFVGATGLPSEVLVDTGGADSFKTQQVRGDWLEEAASSYDWRVVQKRKPTNDQTIKRVFFALENLCHNKQTGY